MLCWLLKIIKLKRYVKIWILKKFKEEIDSNNFYINNEDKAFYAVGTRAKDYRNAFK